jgi:hypothetical protein
MRKGKSVTSMEFYVRTEKCPAFLREYERRLLLDQQRVDEAVDHLLKWLSGGFPLCPYPRSKRFQMYRKQKINERSVGQNLRMLWSYEKIDGVRTLILHALSDHDGFYKRGGPKKGYR